MSNAFFSVPVAQNEPVKSYAPQSKERESLLQVYKSMKNQDPIDIPMYIGGEEVRTATKKTISPPHNHKHIIGNYNVGELKGISITWFLTRKEALSWESKFHKKFKLWHSPARGGKEWFSLSSKQVNEFINWMRTSTEDRNKKIKILRDLLNT